MASSLSSGRNRAHNYPQPCRQGPAEHSSGPGASTKERRSLQASEMPGKPTLPSLIQTSGLPPPSPDKGLPRNTTEIPRKFILFLPGLNRTRTRENLELVYFLPVMKPAWHRKTPQCLPLHQARSCPGHVEYPPAVGTRSCTGSRPRAEGAVTRGIVSPSLEDLEGMQVGSAHTNIQTDPRAGATSS